MSKDKIQLLSPLFLKYQADYEKNPRSRVFAPLAETYRKLGMTDKAMEILSQGIRFHPGRWSQARQCATNLKQTIKEIPLKVNKSNYRIYNDLTKKNLPYTDDYELIRSTKFGVFQEEYLE